MNEYKVPRIHYDSHGTPGQSVQRVRAVAGGREARKDQQDHAATIDNTRQADEPARGGIADAIGLFRHATGIVCTQASANERTHMIRIDPPC